MVDMNEDKNQNVNKTENEDKNKAVNMVIANNIRAILKQQHKKQTELAKVLNTSKQVVNKMLNGTRRINPGELMKIADFLDVKMERLFKGTEEGISKQADQAEQSERGQSLRNERVLENKAFKAAERLLARDREAALHKKQGVREHK